MKTNNGYIPIRPPFPDPGIHLYLQESFRLLKPIVVKDGKIGRHKSRVVVVRMEFLADNHDSRRTIAAKYVDSPIAFEVNHWYPPSALPKWLARRKFTIRSQHVERVQDISESEAINYGVERRGTGYRNYKRPVFGSRKLPLALDSYRSILDIEAKELGKKYAWKANPWVWISKFSGLGCMDRRVRDC